MLEVITTAGLEAALTAKPSDPRKERIRAIRQALFKQDATDDDRDDALDALLELTKE